MLDLHIAEPEDILLMPNIAEPGSATAPVERIADMLFPGLSWTAEREGRVIGMGGLIPVDDRRGRIWAVVSRETSFWERVAALREVQAGLRKSPFPVVDAWVREGWPEGERAVEVLAFRPTGDVLDFDGGAVRRWERIAS